MSLTFRWLGVAGVALESSGQILAIDPFFTRPTLLQMLRPLVSNSALAVEKLTECHYVLVTHSHYDHLLDVAGILRHSGAAAFGSPNTGQLLRRLGISSSQVHEVSVGDHLSLGGFEIEVIRGQHSPIPFGQIFNGKLRPGLLPPLRVWDYRMDVCLGYFITVQDERVLVCAVNPQPADVLFAVAQEPKEYYLRLFQGTQPSIFVPIHWDNFTRPLNEPLHRFIRPGRISLEQLVNLAQQSVPRVRVVIPELLREYLLKEPMERL